MKKLLSLLSVLTINGTTMPIVIVASPYQKQEIIKNSETNYQQINNLKNLNRNKRESNKQINWSNDYVNTNVLFVVDDIEDQTILNSLKDFYPTLDISQIEIIKKIKFEFTSNNIFVKFKVKENSTKYPKKIFFLAFFILSGTWKNLPAIYRIGNEKLIRDWEINFYHWQDSYDIFKENIKNINNASLKSILSEFKLNEFKNQLFNLITVFEILYNKFETKKITDEIDLTVKNKLQDSNKKITTLSKEVHKIKNNSETKKGLEICSSLSGILSGLFGFSIPNVAGVFLSSLTTVIGGFCDLFSIHTNSNK